MSSEQHFHESGSEPVWSYRGYELGNSEFTTAMVHLFRGEISRANVWRQRLDTTTNWAVITTAGVMTFAFGSNVPESHSILLLNMMLITIFLFTEGRRYRYYELWSSRIRLMEVDFFAAMLVPPFKPKPDWAEAVAENLLKPSFPISIWEAVGRRLRRNYLWLYGLLLAVWMLKVWLHPDTADGWSEFYQHASIGTLRGETVIVVVMLFHLVVLLVGLMTRELHEATGEVLADGVVNGKPAPSQSEETDKTAWYRRSRRRQEYLTLIVSDDPEKVAAAIMKEMHRGVTQLHGRGMYSGEDRPVLMCASTETELPALKRLVKSIDPNGFVIISAVQEVKGGDFGPLGT